MRKANPICEKHGPKIAMPDGKLRCVTCRRESARKYAAKQPHVPRTEYWRSREFDGHLRRKYGITLEQRDGILAAQGGVCAICGKEPAGTGTRGGPPRFHVDHDHSTGKVRGLLCGGCNIGLGGFRDSRVNLREAISYLGPERFSEGAGI